MFQRCFKGSLSKPQMPLKSRSGSTGLSSEASCAIQHPPKKRSFSMTSVTTVDDILNKSDTSRVVTSDPGKQQGFVRSESPSFVAHGHGVAKSNNGHSWIVQSTGNKHESNEKTVVNDLKSSWGANLSTRSFSSAAACSRESVESQEQITSAYEEAVQALNQLQSNVKALGKTRETSSLAASRERFQRIYSFLERAGISINDLDKLSIIHVSGTKGKGSTCAFTESILRHHGYSTGFLSSPHLVEVRERIRINGLPLSRAKFTHYFWQVYNRLNDSKEAHEGVMPAYARFLTILSFYVFLQEKPDVVVLEVGLGGEFDCTNVIRKTALCAVTSLGLDHVDVLGSTIDKIAWQKAGIFKRGAIALTGPQPEAALKVLQERAIERQVPLHVVPTFNQYKMKLSSDANSADISLGLQGEVQYLNAALALQLSRLWLRQRQGTTSDGPELDSVEAYPLSDADLQGLYNTRWYGRNQVIRGAGVTYFLDGAHTAESIQQCSEWFPVCSREEAAGASVTPTLLFTTTGTRDPGVMIQQLKALGFRRVAFSPPKAFCATNIRAGQLDTACEARLLPKQLKT